MSKTNITVQLTKNENIVKFVTNSFITQSKSYEFNNIDEAEDSPIAQHLFHLPFVKTVYISQNFIAIEKFPFNLTQVKWEDVQTEVANSISDYLKSGQQVIIKKEDDFSMTTLHDNKSGSESKVAIAVCTGNFYAHSSGDSSENGQNGDSDKDNCPEGKSEFSSKKR